MDTVELWKGYNNEAESKNFDLEIQLRTGKKLATELHWKHEFWLKQSVKNRAYPWLRI